MKVERFSSNPIIRPDMLDGDDGGNINGPSLIRVPEWLPNPLGKYYLYFAHHNGTYIRLAYADNLEGPWKVHKPGTLHLKDAYTDEHVASPDVHIDEQNREILMYYHGPVRAEGGQKTKLAISKDGINFRAFPESFGNSYFRVFQWDDYHYAIGMPGIIYRSKDGRTDFEQGPTLFDTNMRHTALKLDGSILTVFYSVAGDCPEVIYMTTMDLAPDWMNWRPTDPVVVLKPEKGYEGADVSQAPSRRGAIMERVHQLRDPCIYREEGETYLLYSVAGEQGIAMARLAISGQ